MRRWRENITGTLTKLFSSFAIAVLLTCILLIYEHRISNLLGSTTPSGRGPANILAIKLVKVSSQCLKYLDAFGTLRSISSLTSFSHSCNKVATIDILVDLIGMKNTVVLNFTHKLVSFKLKSTKKKST